MPFDVTQPFAIWNILVSDIFGDVNLLILTGIILVILFALKNALAFQTTILVCVLWFMVIVAATDNKMIYVFTLLAIGTFTYFIISRAIRRG